jgi:hypothetical protein
MYMCVGCFVTHRTAAWLDRRVHAALRRPPRILSQAASADFINDPAEHGEHTNTDVLQYYGATAINNICSMCVCKKDVRHIITPQVPGAVETPPPPPHKLRAGFCDVDRSRTGGEAGGIYF